MTRGWRAVRRAVLRRRRLLAALCAGVAVLAGVSAVSAPSPPVVDVVVAARDLAAGTRLAASDLTTASYAPGTAPARLAADATGRVLASPLTAGEPVTDVRLVGPLLTEGEPDLVAVPVRLPDSGMVALLEVGDHIDLVASGPQDGGAGRIADDVRVLAIPSVEVDPPGGSTMPGRLVVVGAAVEEVDAISGAAVRSFVTYTWSSR